MRINYEAITKKLKDSLWTKAGENFTMTLPELPNIKIPKLNINKIAQKLRENPPGILKIKVFKDKPPIEINLSDFGNYGST